MSNLPNSQAEASQAEASQGCFASGVSRVIGGGERAEDEMGKMLLSSGDACMHLIGRKGRELSAVLTAGRGLALDSASAST